MDQQLEHNFAMGSWAILFLKIFVKLPDFRDILQFWVILKIIIRKYCCDIEISDSCG